MTSLVKNIIAGVLAVAAILGVAALFVDVTRNKGDGGDGKLIQEGGRATWGRSLEERDAPRTESDKIVALLGKNLETNAEDSEARISPNELHGNKRTLWVHEETLSVNNHSSPQI